MCFAPQRRAIFHLSSGQLAPHPPLQRAYFSTLRSPKPLEKHSVSRLSYLFVHLHLLSSDSFSSTLLSSNLSLLSASSLLCFSSVHIVGSLTSKLPSINNDTHSIRIYWAELTIAGTNGYKNWDILCKRYFTPPKSNTQPPDEFTTAYGPSPFWVACQLLGYQWAVVGQLQWATSTLGLQMDANGWSCSV